MRSIIGFSIFAIGLGLTAQAFAPGSLSSLFGASFAFVSAWAGHQAASPDASGFASTSVADDASRLARFSPGNRFVPPAEGFQVAGHVTPAATTGLPSLPRDVALAPWQSAVIPVAHNMGKPLAAAPSNPSQRYELVRQIQRELKRAGCYGGSIDGSWGSGSKRAMATFIERVNATLPLTEPDTILLMLVRSQPSGVCLPSCPEGQERSANNRCVPDTVVANGEKQPATEVAKAGAASVLASAATSATDAAGFWPLGEPSYNRFSAARMSIGGPKIEDEPTEPGARGDAAGQDATSVIHSDIAETDEAPANVRQKPQPRPKRLAKSERRYGSGRGSRSVQYLFQHPLGM